MLNQFLRDSITRAIVVAFEPLPEVVAGWQAGSIAFGALDAYSDIDLNFLIEDDASLDRLYAVAEESLAKVSPITASHPAPPGRYYKLKDGGEFLLLDLCFVRAGAADHSLEAERHGRVVPLFDKGDWLRPRALDEHALAIKRDQRCRELQAWFSVSQSFVRKAILRGQHTEALASYWGYTLKPLAELLRIRYCPHRWDFGMRYVERDLPVEASNQLRELAFVADMADLEMKHARAGAWGAELLNGFPNLTTPPPEPEEGDYVLEPAPPGRGFYVSRHQTGEDRQLFADPVTALTHAMNSARTFGKRAFRHDPKEGWILLHR